VPILEIDSGLTTGQTRKFKKLFDHMKNINGKSYFCAKHMHGVLITNSMQSALNIVQANLRYIQPYILNIDDELYIKHIGIDLLLERLSEENPKKRVQYLSARAYISTILANDPEIFKDAALRAADLDKKKIQAMHYVKKHATRCALTKKRFRKGIECHVHHIEGISEKPELADDPKNLIPLCKSVHDEYHSWVIQRGDSVTKASLKRFALEHSYNRDWSMFTGDAIFARQDS
jgi:hypothetical protein